MAADFPARNIPPVKSYRVSGGTYSLLLELGESTTVEVGALGGIRFRNGAYCYTGSAFGPGGFKRVDRHLRVANSDRRNPHWHIDYLLAVSSVPGVVTAPGVRRECEIAERVPGDRIPGFGASDCGCHSHLTFSRSPSKVIEALERIYGKPESSWRKPLERTDLS